GHDRSLYVTQRIFAPAADGTQIPVTLLYRHDTRLDGSAPLWLYGYGAYGDTETPTFSTERLSLVDRGFVYAIAHVRGGGEKGESWHHGGRLKNKANTFTDFIAVAEQLVRLGFTSARRIAASGGCACGLRGVRRRHSGRRSRQHAARPVRGHLRGSAVRRRPQHAAGSLAAAHGGQFFGVRQSGRELGRFPEHSPLFSLRQRPRA